MFLKPFQTCCGLFIAKFYWISDLIYMFFICIVYEFTQEIGIYNKLPKIK